MKIIAPMRGADVYGSGHYQASRGVRKHSGIDIACYEGSKVLSVSEGKVTKIGYPYPATDPMKGHLRYVQVTDDSGLDFRYFYIAAEVLLGATVKVDDVLGITQGLGTIYPGITDHFHFEVRRDGQYLDPNLILEELSK